MGRSPHCHDQFGGGDDDKLRGGDMLSKVRKSERTIACGGEDVFADKEECERESESNDDSDTWRDV